MALKPIMIVFIKINLINLLMEYSVRLIELCVVYTHTIYWENAGLYELKAMYSHILSIYDSILVWYFDVFLRMSHLSYLVLNDLQHSLKVQPRYRTL